MDFQTIYWPSCNMFKTLLPDYCAALRWRHNGRDSISNHQPHHCLLNRLFRRRSKKTSKFRVTGLCVGNSPGTAEFPAQLASNAENVSIWWRHHGIGKYDHTSATLKSLHWLPVKQHIVLKVSVLVTVQMIERFSTPVFVQIIAILGLFVIMHLRSGILCPNMYGHAH